ncbi:MAG: Gfo/Idh/MocA family protein [Planctomycetota bacterium]|jgi:predicted dehydrogenase
MKYKKVSRRQFLRRASGLAVGVIGFPYVAPSSALGKAGSIAPSNRIVMGAIGVGSMGRGDLKDFVRRDAVQVVAVCDVDKKHRDTAKEMVDKRYENKDCATYLDFRELIGRGDLDAVMLALPDHWHAIPAIAAARAGLDIHAQKPLARTIREGRAMVEAANKYGIVWQTGSQQRSGGKFRRACELVRNGRIGKVYKVEVGLPDGEDSDQKPLLPVPAGLDWDFWLGPAPWRPYQDFGEGNCHWDWRWIMDYSGGQLTDWAGHHVDIAHWGLGLDRTGPVEVEGRGVYPDEGTYDVPIAYKFTCKYGDGLEMTVANDRQQPKGRGAVWYGDKGWIQVNRGKLDAEPRAVLDSAIGADEIHLYESDDHKGNFLDCVRTRSETVAPAEVAHRSISVGLLGEIAMLTERKLKWNPEKEVFLNDDEANRMLSRPMRSPWHL